MNEFGEIGIDHLLVEELLDEKTVLLSAGCLCCTIRDDLVGSLVSLHERRAAGEIPPFRQAVIETTGLADPAPILHTLLGHEALEDRFRVDAIVTAVDAVNASFQLDRYPESLRQAAVADRLVLTKTDLASESHADALRARLRRINRGAPLIEARHGEGGAIATLRGRSPGGRERRTRDSSAGSTSPPTATPKATPTTTSTGTTSASAPGASRRSGPCRWRASSPGSSD